MTSLAEFAFSPPNFWQESAAREESDNKRSERLTKRYGALLRLSKCLKSARPEDLVTSVTAELRPVVDFDLLDIILNPGGWVRRQSCFRCCRSVVVWEPKSRCFGGYSPREGRRDHLYFRNQSPASALPRSEVPILDSVAQPGF